MKARRVWTKPLGSMIALCVVFPVAAWSQAPGPSESPCTEFAEMVMSLLKDGQSVVFKHGSASTPTGLGSDSPETTEAFCTAFVQQFQRAEDGSLPQITSPVLGVQDGVDQPEAIHEVEAEYTVEARQERIQGVVILRLQIDEAGSVTDAEVLKGLPLGLSDAAVVAARQWRFEPATRDGEPVPAQRNVVIEFRL